MKPLHNVEYLKFTDDHLFLRVDGHEYEFLLMNISQKLLHASETERNHYRIMASGYGIHWPLLDEDLSIDGLLGITHKPPICKTQKARELQAA